MKLWKLVWGKSMYDALKTTLWGKTMYDALKTTVWGKTMYDVLKKLQCEVKLCMTL
jgi:hypothetical protein